MSTKGANNIVEKVAFHTLNAILQNHLLLYSAPLSKHKKVRMMPSKLVQKLLRGLEIRVAAPAYKNFKAKFKYVRDVH